MDDEAIVSMYLQGYSLKRIATIYAKFSKFTLAKSYQFRNAGTSADVLVYVAKVFCNYNRGYYNTQK